MRPSEILGVDDDLGRMFGISGEVLALNIDLRLMLEGRKREKEAMDERQQKRVGMSGPELVHRMKEMSESIPEGTDPRALIHSGGPEDGGWGK